MCIRDRYESVILIFAGDISPEELLLSRISDPAGQTITAWRVAGSITVGSA